MLETVIISGYGGQGNQFIGKMLCLAAMKDKYILHFPFYGPETRSGVSRCLAIVSDEEIGSPVVTSPETLIIMNQPSLKWLDNMKPGKLVIINASLADYANYSEKRSDLKIVLVETSELVKQELPLNMILLGVYLKKKNIVSIENVLMAMDEKFQEEIREGKLTREKKEKIFNANKKALLAGYNLF